MEGEEVVISEIYESVLSERLLELGCLPGSKLKLIKRSHLNGPILIEIDQDFLLSVGLVESRAIRFHDRGN
jgi:Fe2+ transport system protein FeoA